MELQRQYLENKNKNASTLMTATIKRIISSVLNQKGISFEEIILFGSRARGNFDKYSDYDILVIIDEGIDARKKIDIVESIRTELAKLLISSDIILKSRQEAEYYKEKIGSVVREAFKEGVLL